MDGSTLVFLTATVRVSFAVLTPLKFLSSDSSGGKTGGASSKVFDLGPFDDLSHVLEPGLLVPGPPPPPYYHPPPSPHPHPHPHPFFLPPGPFSFGHHAPYHAPCVLQCNIPPQHSVYSKPAYPYPPRGGGGGGGGGGGAGGIMPRKVKQRPQTQGLGPIPQFQGVLIQDPGLIQQITGAIQQGQVGLSQTPGQAQQIPGNIQQGQVNLLQTSGQAQQVPGPLQQDQVALLQAPDAGQGVLLQTPGQHISGPPQQSHVAFLPTPGTIQQGQGNALRSQGGITQAIFPELEQLKSPQEHSCVSTKEESTSSPPSTTVNDNEISFMTEENENENVDTSEDFN